ncbi:DUF1109 domain-containing protein [Paraburkholderia sp. DHOC27]|uniref:DUF1109 domain-containing protein n=1 Tax=Paraburkholderia sp. DHOC27 TaxID=2303330 RepID=UPI000E3CF041|nr:DUF1109 domain-containing protein [Paraburkholderia sp. DHOC27]RFU49155.1 DUF1109 domain-containing protein [Paraburkholderia sp. DHOC27]
MRTDDLVDFLASGITPVQHDVPARRFGIAMAVALLGSAALMAKLFGVRPDLAAATHTLLFWGKFVFALVMSVGALVTLSRLARPGARVGMRGFTLLVPVTLVWIAGICVIATAAPEHRMPDLLGASWSTCPFNITLLSIPGFIAVFWAVRGLAPTQLRRSGAACGLLASSIGTLVYCLHCPEMNPAFWSVWYVLGMLIPTFIGAMLGPRLLRW